MYTIKQAAARSGVTVQLLRAWERRYGVVEPTRTASGYRLYDDAAIARLRAMRYMVDHGWSPSVAATHLRELDDAAVGQILGDQAAADNGRAAGATDAASADGLTRRFVDSAAALDEQSFEHILDEMFARGSFEQVASELLMPALVALGEGWAQGKVDVAAEHAAAGAIQRRLGMAFVAAGLPRDEEVVLVGLPPGAQHDLGALAFATAARRAGLGVRYLGADLPINDWLEAVDRTKARAVVIGVIMGRDLQPALKVARAIRELHARVLIAFGGRRAESVPTDDLQPVITLPQDLPSAVEALAVEMAPAA